MTTDADPAILVNSGRWEDAVKACRAELETHPMDADAYRHLGIALAHLAQVSESETAYRRAIYLDRRNPYPHYLLAMLLKEDGRTMEARREFRAVCKKLKVRNMDDVVSPGSSATTGDLLAVISLWLDDDEQLESDGDTAGILDSTPDSSRR